MSTGEPSEQQQQEEEEQQQLATKQEAELKAELAAEKAKKEAEDKRVQAQKVRALKVGSGGGGGLFGSGTDTLG